MNELRPPPPFRDIYANGRRRRVALDRAVRITIALLLAAGGILIGGAVAGWWGPWKMSSATNATSTVVTSRPASNAQDVATVKTGCAATALMSARISEAQQLAQPDLLKSVATGPGTPWWNVTAMETVGNDSTYRPLANDVRGFIQAFTVAQTTGQLSVVELAMTSVQSSCRTLGQSTSTP